MPLSASVIGRLNHQHELISTFLGEYSEEQLKFRVNPEKWSLFENIVHLAAYQPNFLQRIERMLKNERPQFKPYKADDDPLFHEYIKKSPSAIEEDVYQKRIMIKTALESADEHQLQHWGEHMKYGKLSLANWVEFFLLHEAHHLFTAFMLSRQLPDSGGK
jgi:hypothetical protein